MDELIAIGSSDLGGQRIQTVNARELHAFLEVTSRFNDWITRRINDFGFIENQDFCTLTQNLVSGGKSKEYFVSLGGAV